MSRIILPGALFFRCWGVRIRRSYRVPSAVPRKQKHRGISIFARSDGPVLFL